MRRIPSNASVTSARDPDPKDRRNWVKMELCHQRPRHILVRIRILFSILVFGVAALSQEPDQKPTGMGVSTGVAHPAVKDSQSRPITAGGFVDHAPAVFEDITKQAGLDKFR